MTFTVTPSSHLKGNMGESCNALQKGLKKHIFSLKSNSKNIVKTITTVQLPEFPIIKLLHKNGRVVLVSSYWHI